MTDFVFYANTYWELSWLVNVIRATGAPVHTGSSNTKYLARRWGLTLVDNVDHFHTLVMCVYHMGDNRVIRDRFFDQGKQVIILQHAFDSQINFMDTFWGEPTDRFSAYLVGGVQDYLWLQHKHGPGKIIYTGMPRLDDVYHVKHNFTNFDDIFKTVGHKKFYLAAFADASLYGREAEQAYLKLHKHSPIPVAFKLHPGGDYEAGVNWLKKIDPDIIYLDDNAEDLYWTYKLIKASQGVICLESFLAVEATLLEKPVIFFGHNLIPPEYYQREEHKGVAKHRLPLAMSSTLDKPQFTPYQQALSSWYAFDNQNTARVTNFLNTSVKKAAAFLVNYKETPFLNTSLLYNIHSQASEKLPIISATARADSQILASSFNPKDKIVLIAGRDIGDLSLGLALMGPQLVASLEKFNESSFITQLKSDLLKLKNLDMSTGTVTPEIITKLPPVHAILLISAWDDIVNQEGKKVALTLLKQISKKVPLMVFYTHLNTDLQVLLEKHTTYTSIRPIGALQSQEMGSNPAFLCTR